MKRKPRLLQLLSLEDRIAPASFQGLGDLPGGDFQSGATGASADGLVVVGRGTGSSGGEAFRWTAGGGMVGLGDLPGGVFGSRAYDVSADGSVIVGSGESGAGGEAFRWTASGGMVGLGYLPGGGYSYAGGVSADGLVIIGTSGGSSGPGEAFRWTVGGGMVGLGDLPGGEFLSQAWDGVSADGSVVVGMSDGLFREAFRWTAGGGMVGLGYLPGGGTYSLALGVSADGSVVVGGGTGSSGPEAFRWTAGGGMVGLGDLPGGSFDSGAQDVSADGSVVVGDGAGSSGPEAFRWTAADGMRSVREILVSDYGLGSLLTGWSLTSGVACSADGSVIVGYGINPGGVYEAWIARLDSPAPTIVGVQINDGSSQRSRVTSLTVTFDATVTFAGPVADAFTLSRNGGKPVSFSASAQIVAGRTMVTLSNFTGGSTQFGSLADGRYTLTALSSQITANGQNLDGDGDGQPGGNYTFGDAQGLFRFFGDINGDRHVDIADFGLFSTSYGLHIGQTGFNTAFDFNGDGVIDIADFGQFAIRMFTVLP